MKNLKPVPADKKKSIGKLPSDVRNKMGYAKKGSMMKANKGGETVKKFPKDMLFRPTPEQAEKMSNDPTRKARLKKLLENRIKNTKPDSSETKQKLKDALKKLGSAASPAAATAKKTMEIIKKSKGGEMMKAKKGVMVTGKKEEDDVSKYVKSIKLPDAKDVRDVVKKKSMGGEMKQGYGAARTSGMGLQDEDLIPGKSMDYYKDLM